MARTVEIPDKALPYRWVVMGVWLLGGVAGFMMISTLGILLPAISLELRLSPSQQGLLGSAAFWGSLALAVPLSWWTSRFRPKMLTTVTLVLGTLLLVVQGWAPHLAILLVGRLGFGIAILAREPARALLVQQWFPRREIILVNSISNALFGLVVGGGLAITPYILRSTGDNWRTVLYSFAVLFSVLTILWMVLGKERVPSGYSRQQSAREIGIRLGVLAHRDLWVGGFGFLGASLAGSAFLSFFPTLMLDAYEVSLQWSGAVLALGFVVGGFSGLGVGYMVMAIDQRKGILIVLGVLMAGTYVGMTLVSSVPMLTFLSLLNGVAWGFWPILYTVPFHLPGIRPREVAVALAFTMTMISAGTVLGPLVTGFLQAALGDLRLALFIVSLAALSLGVSGTMLRLGGDRDGAERSDTALDS